MKPIRILFLCKMFLFVLTLSCSREEVIQKEEKNTLLLSENRTDFAWLKNDTIVEQELSPYKKILDTYRKKYKKVMPFSNEEYYLYSYNGLNQLTYDFFDLQDYPVNIISKENNSGSLYLTTVGVNKELVYARPSHGDNQKFYMKIVPPSAGGGLYIYTFMNGQKYILSTGHYTNQPNRTIVYAKSENSNYIGTNWDILGGATVHDDSYILQNNDAIGYSGEPNYWNLYYKVMGNTGNTIVSMDKYMNQGRQEFEIRPVDDFEIVSLEFDNPNNGMFVPQPDFVTTWFYSNNTSLQQSVTTGFSKRASLTSSWSKTNGGSISVNTGFKIGLPFIADGKISVSSTASYSATYGKSEVMEDVQTYNFPIQVAPRTSITGTATVGRYLITLNYTAKVRGKKTGKLITLRGQWSGITCTEIKVVLEERSLLNGSVITKEYDGIPKNY